MAELGRDWLSILVERDLVEEYLAGLGVLGVLPPPDERREEL